METKMQISESQKTEFENLVKNMPNISFRWDGNTAIIDFVGEPSLEERLDRINNVGFLFQRFPQQKTVEKITVVTVRYKSETAIPKWCTFTEYELAYSDGSLKTIHSQYTNLRKLREKYPDAAIEKQMRKRNF